MSTGKQYGLQLPKKNTHGLVQKHAAFGDDSDSEKSDGGGTDWTKRALKATEKTTVKRQTKIEMQRAIDEDNSVYQYDEIYDQLQKGKQDKNQKEKEKKPKYIQKLMVAAEKRKIENERRIERQVQKEREAEGEEFKDKETFVTAAYKKKLEEFAKLDAEQKRQDMLEEIGDVTKQQDMGGFYRHLYQTTVNGPKEGSPKTSVKEESDHLKKDSGSSSRHSHSKSVSGSQENSPAKIIKEEKESSISSKKLDPKKDSRQYRKRKDSESSTDKNKDADTDGASSSSSSSSSDSESADEKSSHSETEDPKRIRAKEYSATEQPTPVETIPLIEPVNNLPPPEPQKSIWEKRTVGPVFDAALKRYLERKNARLARVS